MSFSALGLANSARRRAERDARDRQRRNEDRAEALGRSRLGLGGNDPATNATGRTGGLFQPRLPDEPEPFTTSDLAETTSGLDRFLMGPGGQQRFVSQVNAAQQEAFQEAQERALMNLARAQESLKEDRDALRNISGLEERMETLEKFKRERVPVFGPLYGELLEKSLVDPFALASNPEDHLLDPAVVTAVENLSDDDLRKAMRSEGHSEIIEAAETRKLLPMIGHVGSEALKFLKEKHPEKLAEVKQDGGIDPAEWTAVLNPLLPENLRLEGKALAIFEKHAARIFPGEGFVEGTTLEERRRRRATGQTGRVEVVDRETGQFGTFMQDSQLLQEGIENGRFVTLSQSERKSEATLLALQAVSGGRQARKQFERLFPGVDPQEFLDAQRSLNPMDVFMRGAADAALERMQEGKGAPKPKGRRNKIESLKAEFRRHPDSEQWEVIAEDPEFLTVRHKENGQVQRFVMPSE